MHAMRCVALLGVLLAVAAAGCSGGDEVAATTTTRAPVDRSISSADLGDAWPLTVSGGTLRCEGPGAVSFITDEGIVYAVNGTGTAWSRANNLAWSDIDTIHSQDPSTGGKAKLGRLIAAGLRLCKTAEQPAVSTSG
jgi:hypothetical protein